MIKDEDAVFDIVQDTYMEKAVFNGPVDKYRTSYVIPDGVKTIGAYAFRECWLTSIEIPKSVTVIGKGAFYGCPALKTIKVPQGLKVSNCGLGKDVQVIYY